MDVQQRTNPNEPAGPAIEKKGSKELPTATVGHAEAEKPETRARTTAVNSAFGLGALATAASACGSCAISKQCSSSIENGGLGEDDGGLLKWY